MAKENEILHGNVCSLCSAKLGFTEKNHTHLLSDGTLCQKCQLTLTQLMTQKEWWVDAEEYKEVMEKNYSPRKAHTMPLEKARALLALRNDVCDGYLRTVGLESGPVFAVQEVFAMPPSPAIFILRARKLRNKAVLQGFPLRGEVKKGDSVYIDIFGSLYGFEALDVVPAGTNRLVRETFFDQLSTNVHKHRVDEDGRGWIIIGTEDWEAVPQGVLAAIGK